MKLPTKKPDLPKTLLGELALRPFSQDGCASRLFYHATWMGERLGRVFFYGVWFTIVSAPCLSPRRLAEPSYESADPRCGAACIHHVFFAHPGESVPGSCSTTTRRHDSSGSQEAKLCQHALLNLRQCTRPEPKNADFAGASLVRRGRSFLCFGTSRLGIERLRNDVPDRSRPAFPPNSRLEI